MSSQNEKLRYVGREIPIQDALDKAMGRTRYLSDGIPARSLHAKLVLSEIPHGRVVKIDASPAETPGFVKIYSFLNTPDRRFNTQKWFVGQPGVDDQTLFPEKVRYVGEPVAAVVAIDRRAAERAARRVRIEYEPLPFVIDPEEALQGKVEIHPHAVDPVLFRAGKSEEMDEVFKTAWCVVEDRVVTPKLHPAAMENHAVVAVPHAGGGVTVHSPCQIIHAVRMHVAEITALPFHKVRVVKTVVGGSFGGKQEVTFEPLAAFMALDLGQPVFIELARRESILSTRTRTKTVGYVKTAVDPEGRILARDIRLIVDAGAYTSNGRVISMAMGRKPFRLYRIPQQRYRAYVAHTNTPVSGAMRGYGSPQIHAATEINLDQAAGALGMDPVELRLRNLVHPHDPDLSGGPPIGNARIMECLELGAAEFDWKGRWGRSPRRGRIRTGVGVACSTHVNGYFGAYQDFGTMTLRFLEDGSMALNACLHELGHGVLTIMRQIVSEIISIDPALIAVPEPDTDTCPYDIGCQASRGTYVTGRCAEKVATELRSIFARHAAIVLETAPEEIVFQNGLLWVRGRPEDKRSYREMVGLIQKKLQEELVSTVTHHSPGNPGSYAADFAEVVVDTCTGRVRVTEFLAVHDIGKAVNPGFVKGQIHGGVQMGIGMALSEELVVDERTGHPKTEGFERYHVVNAPDMPHVRVMLVERMEQGGPFGAKSVGEIATVGVAPAIVNAVNHALGTRLTVLPLSAERIVQGLSGNKQSDEKCSQNAIQVKEGKKS
ncbi:MAG: aldehyde oxidase [Desulfobacteraceae bacterium]|nr:MAG: aldehyde oxidase [Desulfobacteraceae bacterium]